MEHADGPASPPSATPAAASTAASSSGWLRPLVTVVLLAAAGVAAWWVVTPGAPTPAPTATDDDGGSLGSSEYYWGRNSDRDGRTRGNRSADNADNAGADNAATPGDPLDVELPPEDETGDGPPDGDDGDDGDGDSSDESRPQTMPRQGEVVVEGDGSDGEGDPELEPFPADHPLVQRLLSLLRFRDFAAIARLLSGMQADPVQAWMLVAGALVATDSMYARAVLVGILAGDYPELGWITEVPILERATSRLFALLLLYNPDWVRPDGGGYQPFQKKMLLTMFDRAAPPAPAVVGQAGYVDSQRLTALVRMVRETDAADVQSALLEFVGRTVATVEPELRPSDVLVALQDLLPSASRNRELLTGVLAAIWMADAASGAEALTDALINGDADVRRAAAIDAMQTAWEQARVSPAGDLWTHLLDAAVPTGDGRATTGESRLTALELIGALADADRIGGERRADLIGRLDRAVFGAGDELPADPGVSQVRADQLQLLAALQPEDGDLVARLDRLASRDVDPVVRRAALESLGGMPLESARDALRRIARSADAATPERTTALGALVAWSEAPDTPSDHHDSTRSLLTQMAFDRAEVPSVVRSTAARLLGAHWGEDVDSRAQVRRLAEDDPDAAVRAAAITGMAEGAPADDAQVRREIADWLKARAKLDPSPAVRSAADRGRSLLAERDE